MISRPRHKVSTISMVVLAGLVLNGCAGKQVWSPELEAATITYQEIAQDPLVVALAAEELAVARVQLEIAQTAQDHYQSASVVQHEAKVAELRALTAQQRARALSANHKLQLAVGQQTLLSAEVVMAATAPDQLEPVMAASTPAFDASADITSQLTALSQQLAALQSQLQAQSVPHSPTTRYEPLQAAQMQPEPLIQEPLLAEPLHAQIPHQAIAHQAIPQQEIPQQAIVQAEIPQAMPSLPESLPPIAFNSEPLTTPQYPEGALQPMEDLPPMVASDNLTSEPLIGAAMPAESSVREMPLPSAKQLHRELLGMNARSSSQGMALTLGDRYFEGRSARLWSKRASRHLDNVASFLDRNASLSLTIEAHTDDEATSEENHDLSMDRAVAIKSQLVLRGIDESRISANGFGETRPIAGNDTPLGRLQNRRVEMIFPDVPTANL